MAKKNINRLFGLFAALTAGILVLTGCIPSKGTIAAESQKQVEANVDATSMPESQFDINHWDEVALSQDLILRNIDDGVIEVVHSFPWAANSLLVQMPDGTFVWAGSTYTPEAAQLVLRWLDEYYANYTIVGIVTGYHVDNLGGSAALIERGYKVYGSDLTVDLLAEKGEETRDYLIDLLKESNQSFYADYYKEIPYLAPTHVFPVDDGISLQFGGETVTVYYPGPTQAKDKLVVYFPEKKILFGSCMVLGGDEVGNMQEANVISWQQAILRLKQFDADLVIPGHGDRTDPGLIDHTFKLLENYTGNAE
jgi:glyoxylase-like metal-dependent hydrolase (beta-lactamase superfamily II)